MKTNKNQPFIADALPEAEIQKLLFKIGRAIKYARKKRTTIDKFAYEIKISRTQLGKYESGHNMVLSTFLRVLHGLDISPQDFFRDLEKTSK